MLLDRVNTNKFYGIPKGWIILTDRHPLWPGRAWIVGPKGQHLKWTLKDFEDLKKNGENLSLPPNIELLCKQMDIYYIFLHQEELSDVIL